MYFLYRILFINAHGMDFLMKVTQPYTEFYSSLYAKDNLILTLRIMNANCQNFKVNYEPQLEMKLLGRPW